MSGNKARHTTPQTKIRSPCVVFTKCRFARKRGLVFQSFADLVVIAKEFYPIPFRTRPSKPSASMVLRLKPRESRTLPGLPRTEIREPARTIQKNPAREIVRGFLLSKIQPASSGAAADPNSFSIMKSGSRYCGKLLDMLSVRSTCRHRPSRSAKWSKRAPAAMPAATKP